MKQDWDSIVVGAGPAGLSAALTLGRARRRVLVLDSGAPRNFAAREMHGVLGHDGLDPAELRARGREELARYGLGVRDVEAAGAEARRIYDGFEIAGEAARTVIIATGLLDETPAIEGFDEIYGISAHNCPYCDGWEHRDKRIVTLGGGAHLPRMLRQWSADVVALPAGDLELDETGQEELVSIGVEVVRDPVERFVAADGRLEAIEFAGGRSIERDALFFRLGYEPRTTLAEALGCELDESGYIVADERRATTVDGVYAAGNCADPMQNVPMAIADGARAGVAVNGRLVEGGVLQPVGG